MIIWNTDLLPHLCDKHLDEMDSNCCDIHEMVKNHKPIDDPFIAEFSSCPIVLVRIMHEVRKEMDKRGLFHAKCPDPYEFSENAVFDGLQQERNYVPYFTKDQQIQMLKKKTCLCGISFYSGHDVDIAVLSTGLS